MSNDAFVGLVEQCSVCGGLLLFTEDEACPHCIRRGIHSTITHPLVLTNPSTDESPMIPLPQTEAA
jgi:hypothetical protein